MTVPTSFPDGEVKLLRLLVAELNFWTWGLMCISDIIVVFFELCVVTLDYRR